MKIGIMPASPFKPGRIAVISRSGTLMYESSHNLSVANFGQSIRWELEENPINGTPLIEAFDTIRNGANIDGVIVVGEIGGDAERRLHSTLLIPNLTNQLLHILQEEPAKEENGACRCHCIWKLWICRIQSIHVCQGKRSSCQETC